MAALTATSLNGVKIYNLASGKTLPQWVAEKTRKALSKDEGAHHLSHEFVKTTADGALYSRVCTCTYTCNRLPSAH